jgi:NAD(P)-dependent dehydrogenase (short-subunit alcohol dehydrogenase family)
MILKNKVAVIYGAGGGIGSAIARAFAREGAKVFLTGLHGAAVEAVAKEIVSDGGSVPNKKVVWLVLDNCFNFTQDKTEWKDTNVVFEISKEGDKTKIHFTHHGLVPE